jgi:hypothetical protein
MPAPLRIGVRHALHPRSISVAVAGIVARMEAMPDTSGIGRCPM